LFISALGFFISADDESDMSAPRLIGKPFTSTDVTPMEREETTSMTQPSSKVKRKN